MKKVVLCAAMAAVFSCEGKNEGALILSGQENFSKIISQSEISESGIRAQESRELSTRGNNSISRVNYREISQPTVNGDQITITVQDFSGDEVVGEMYERSYPLQRNFLRYIHDFERGVSHPVEELFAMVNNVEYSNIRGKVVANSEFMNEEESLIHQLRINKNLGQNGYQMNDNSKKATPFMETFISKGDWEEVIEEAKLREGKVIYYEKVNGSTKVNNVGKKFSKAGDNNFEYQRQEVFEDWKRPDGSIFTKRTEKETPIRKAKPAAPKTTPRQHVVNQPAPSGGRGGFFRRAFGW